MKNIYKLVYLPVALMLVISACHKVEDLPFHPDGTVVTLSASATSVTPTVADSNNALITFSWTNPKYATDSSTYKFVLEIDSTGKNFSKKTTKTVIGQLSTSLTGREINAILLNYGYSLGVPVSLDVRVVSSYGNNNEMYTSNTVKFTTTAYSDPSILTTTATSATLALATSSQIALTFNWSRSFTGYSDVVNYFLEYDSATKNFVNGLSIAIGPDIFTKPMTQGELNETALNSGIPGGNQGRVEYRIRAVTAQGAVSRSNIVSVLIQSYLPILRFYMPGGYQAATGNGSDWDPGSAPEFIRDLRPGLLNNMYYMYIYLPTGSEFKITQGRDWAINYGSSAGNLVAGGSNFQVASAGVYRISFNRATLKYDIRAGRMGFVGGATGAGWNPPNVFPTYAMGAPAKNLFVGLTNLTVDGWKLIDNDAWNSGSNLPDETRSYGTPGASGSTLEVNGANFSNPPSAGRYRVIWDGRDVNNVKYHMSAATEMRLVGDGINVPGVGDWDPPTSPQMTYMGNGVWTITVALRANKDIKFLAGNAWGAFDYEDNSGQSQVLGTPRPIKWEGGNNFKTPTTAGTYTITLNEKTQTATIN